MNILKAKIDFDQGQSTFWMLGPLGVKQGFQ